MGENGEIRVNKQRDRQKEGIGIHALIGDPGQLLGDLKAVQFRLKWDTPHTQPHLHSHPPVISG